jgi:hypothetical protein
MPHQAVKIPCLENQSPPQIRIKQEDFSLPSKKSRKYESISPAEIEEIIKRTKIKKEPADD